ncbi:NAD(P)/FAD-dependent oxidoreductase [Nesterenkonia rhizosphaerae]|uniref:NAD(P)/FAD-dependent oxidoreductase n=1 Tax=Nesterenkonia rhizosphaerae TaxID=1348272 RepID=A0ABP9FVK8_9MICC
MPEVLVVGAGPVGLLLAGELRRRGIDVELLDQRPQASPGSRAIGIHPPVLAALEASGLTERLLEGAVRVTRGEARSAGQVVGAVRFDQISARLNSARFPFVATLPQAVTEGLLGAGAPSPERGVRVTGILSGDHHVQVHTDAGERRAAVTVLAGGAHSRHLVYARPEAYEYPDRYLMTDAHTPNSADESTAVVHLDADGVLESFPLPGQRRRFVAWDAPGASSEPVQMRARLSRALEGREEADVDEVSGFGVRRFVAPRLRNGRVFVIGDAAHEVSPIGGQGMNLGLLDAATLAPLIASWVRTGTVADTELQHWEQSRLRSARRAAALAGLNTRLGRPAKEPLNAARRNLVRAMLGPGTGRIFARAYGMGFDLDAAPPRRRPAVGGIGRTPIK